MTLDATPAGANADSYLTVAGADSLAGEDLGPEVTAWLAATTASKEAALKRATREIDGYLRTGVSAYSSTQALRFPRSTDVVSGSPVIPRAIVLATYQQAIFVLKNATVLAAANTRRARSQASASEPDVSYSQDNDPTSLLSPIALHYLSDFRAAGRGDSRAGRMQAQRVTSGFRGW